MNWKPVIGLEVHVQLSTLSKIFSGSSTAYGAAPNTQACAIDLALPGTLPVLNREAVRMAVKFGLAIQAQINSPSFFSRKNYFYPDLPKGYQISQFDVPIVAKGQLAITLEDGSQKIINITRAHLEEDAGKSVHTGFEGMTGIDLNRAGTALIEIVSEPELASAKEAVSYLKALHSLVTYLEICDGNMQEGSFRCDANVSVMRTTDTKLGTRAEIKNVNSFRFVEKAINYEIERQIAVLEAGGEILQETRLYDSDKNETRSMRLKENANDYRYFHDPDLLPVYLSDTMMQEVKEDLPELPWEKQERFIKIFELSCYDASVLVSSRDIAQFFEETVALTKAPAKQAANWIMGDLMGALNKENLEITASPVKPQSLATLLDRIADNTISGKIGKTVFESLWAGEEDVDHIIESKGLKQVTDSSAIEKIILDIITAYPEQLAEYRAGKDRLFGFFVGEVMKQSKGKANPAQVNELLKEKLQP